MSDSPYRTLIDAPNRAFIARSDSACSADAVGSDIAGKRRAHDAICAVFRQPKPPGVTVSDGRPECMAARRHHAGTGDAMVVRLRRGGFRVGGLERPDETCAEPRAATGLRLISVDRLPQPEHPDPAPVRVLTVSWPPLRAAI